MNRHSDRLIEALDKLKRHRHEESAIRSSSLHNHPPAFPLTIQKIGAASLPESFQGEPCVFRWKSVSDPMSSGLIISLVFIETITIDVAANHLRLARKKHIDTTSLPELAEMPVVLGKEVLTVWITEETAPGIKRAERNIQSGYPGLSHGRVNAVSSTSS